MLHSLLYVHGPFSIIKRNKIMESIPSSKYQSAAITKYIRFMFQFFSSLNWKLERQTKKEKGASFMWKQTKGDANSMEIVEIFSEQRHCCNPILCHSYFADASWMNECVAHPFMSLFKHLIALSSNTNSCQWANIKICIQISVKYWLELNLEWERKHLLWDALRSLFHPSHFSFKVDKQYNCKLK